MSTSSDNLSIILNRVHLATQHAHRKTNEVALLAVSKTQSADKIRALYHAGQKQFAENYVQEALQKQALLRDLAIEWHFIGNIQSNKAKLIASNFDWVHSVNRLGIAEKLNHFRGPLQKPLDICIEVNIDDEQSKSGALPENLLTLAKNIATLKNIKLRGLMVIPKKDSCIDVFQKTAELQHQLIQNGLLLDTLSMGMSSDFELAIEAGSTIVRIGTALFGERG